MNKKLLLVICIANLFTVSSAYANKNKLDGKTTISAGYAHIMIENSDPMYGGAFSFHKEVNSQFGVLTSINYVQGNFKERNLPNKIIGHYYSFMIGPTLRLHDMFSIYAIGGAGKFTLEYDKKTLINKTALSWGVGVMVNPTETIVASLGYQHSRFSIEKPCDMKFSIDGFIASVGYRF